MLIYKGMTYKKQSIEQKLAIVLRYMNDYAHAEVEQKNGISNGEISNWVRRHQQEGQNGLESKKWGNPFAASH